MGGVHIMDNLYIMYQQTAHTNPVILQVSLHQACYVRLPWELSLCTSQIRSFTTLWMITTCMYLHYHRASPSRCLNEDSKKKPCFCSPGRTLLQKKSDCLSRLQYTCIHQWRELAFHPDWNGINPRVALPLTLRWERKSFWFSFFYIPHRHQLVWWWFG